MRYDVADASLGEQVGFLRGMLNVCEIPAELPVRSFLGQNVYELGHAFFPGGSGILDPSRSTVSTIVLGSDWGNENTFNNRLALTKHRDETLHGRAKKMLPKPEYDLADCFFTNAWPVLRLGAAEESTYHEMRDPGPFTERCREFFQITLNLLKPKLVIMLGVSPAWFVSPYVGKDWLPTKYGSPKHVRMKDLNDDFVRGASGIVFVAATHWSMPNTLLRGMTRQEEIDLMRRAKIASRSDDDRTELA